MLRPGLQEAPVPTVEWQAQTIADQIARERERVEELGGVASFRLEANTALFDHLSGETPDGLIGVLIVHDPDLLPGRNMINVNARDREGPAEESQ